MKIASCNNFFVYYVVMFVRLNYIELHHFNLICLSFSFFTKFICTQHCIRGYSKWPSPLVVSIGEIQTSSDKCDSIWHVRVELYNISFQLVKFKMSKTKLPLNHDSATVLLGVSFIMCMHIFCCWSNFCPI